MKLAIESTPIQDLLVIRHDVFEDARGVFVECFRRDVGLRYGAKNHMPNDRQAKPWLPLAEKLLKADEAASSAAVETVIESVVDSGERAGA